MDIVSALFIDNIELRHVPGPSTRIDLTGIQFSAAAPQPVPLTWAPHLVNIVDFHRLLTALSGGGCVSPKAIGFDPACAGHGPAEKERTYIEAYRHFCRVWPV